MQLEYPRNVRVNVETQRLYNTCASTRALSISVLESAISPLIAQPVHQQPQCHCYLTFVLAALSITDIISLYSSMLMLIHTRRYAITGSILEMCHINEQKTGSHLHQGSTALTGTDILINNLLNHM